MGTFSYASGNSVQMSTKTFGQLKTIAARVIGAGAEPNTVGAGDAIHMALDKLNEYEWEYLSVRGADAVPSAHPVYGNNVIACPTLIKKVLSLRYNGRPLLFARRGDYDKAAWSDSGGAEPTHYSTFNTVLEGYFELLPPGSVASGTVEMRFYRPLRKPSGDAETLDIQQWMERFVILEAQTQLALEHQDDMAKVDRLARRASEALAGILGSDRSPGPQEDQGFTPFVSWGNKNMGYPYDHAWPYVLEGDYE